MTSILVQMGVDSLTSVDRRSFVLQCTDGAEDVIGNEAEENDAGMCPCCSCRTLGATEIERGRNANDENDDR